MENIEEQIKNVIHKLRPYLQRWYCLCKNAWSMCWMYHD